MLPTIAYVKGYDIENQINTSQSIIFGFKQQKTGWIWLISSAFQEDSHYKIDQCSPFYVSPSWNGTKLD